MKLIISITLTQISGMSAILSAANNKPEFNLIIALLLLNAIALINLLFKP